MRTGRGFAVWLTGLPASGKSSIARELAARLQELRTPVVVLESDRLREILTPDATYSPEERDRFYRTMAMLGELITRGSVNVIFDATANRLAYRDYARTLIPKFVETYVRCPLEVCMKRDPKGIYGRARSGTSGTVPGLQSAYEPPMAPEITLDCENSVETAAGDILDTLRRLSYL
jgi:adenylylsulfate kinase